MEPMEIQYFVVNTDSIRSSPSGKKSIQPLAPPTDAAQNQQLLTPVTNLASDSNIPHDDGMGNELVPPSCEQLASQATSSGGENHISLKADRKRKLDKREAKATCESKHKKKSEAAGRAAVPAKELIPLEARVALGRRARSGGRDDRPLPGNNDSSPAADVGINQASDPPAAGSRGATPVGSSEGQHGGQTLGTDDPPTEGGQPSSDSKCETVLIKRKIDSIERDNRGNETCQVVKSKFFTKPRIKFVEKQDKLKSYGVKWNARIGRKDSEYDKGSRSDRKRKGKSSLPADYKSIVSNNVYEVQNCERGSGSVLIIRAKPKPEVTQANPEIERSVKKKKSEKVEKISKVGGRSKKRKSITKDGGTGYKSKSSLVDLSSRIIFDSDVIEAREGFRIPTTFLVNEGSRIGVKLIKSSASHLGC